MASLFDPVQLGNLQLKNRIFMSPMTRARTADRIPTASTVTYYTQRAGAGLIITEATTVSKQGNGSISTPGIYNAEQITGWKKVTDSVHQAGGKIICQLWHTGRVSHSSLQDNNASPVSASDVHGEVITFTENGFEKTSKPRALTAEEIPGIVEHFVQGARNAIEAGFDGVEIHSGSGYLLDQFLRDGTNQRTDNYGGSIENRCRLVLEIVDAVSDAIGGGRTAIRITPMLVTWDCADSNPEALFTHLAKELSQRPIAFLDLVERNDGPLAVAANDDGGIAEASVAAIRKTYTGNYVASGAFNRERAIEAVESGYAEALAMGRDYLSNPDLAERWEIDAEMSPPADLQHYYGDGSDTGYIDYPSMKEQTTT